MKKKSWLGYSFAEGIISSCIISATGGLSAQIKATIHFHFSRPDKIQVWKESRGTNYIFIYNNAFECDHCGHSPEWGLLTNAWTMHWIRYFSLFFTAVDRTDWQWKTNINCFWFMKGGMKNHQSLHLIWQDQEKNLLYNLLSMMESNIASIAHFMNSDFERV